MKNLLIYMIPFYTLLVLYVFLISKKSCKEFKESLIRYINYVITALIQDIKEVIIKGLIVSIISLYLSVASGRPYKVFFEFLICNFDHKKATIVSDVKVIMMGIVVITTLIVAVTPWTIGTEAEATVTVIPEVIEKPIIGVGIEFGQKTTLRIPGLP